ncbi:hypothetical protein DFH09DRAFT_1189028 [Mycena vulgaris]|nr:hypothetical protein DFH09DRAFT_1189028 [Mycena vulgaris]
MAVALYETARDLFAEWLAGMHSHIPWGLRFIQGEDIFCSANRWPVVHIDPEYPPIPDCGDRGLRALFGRDGPKARTPGVIEQSSVPESAEPVDMLYYDTLEDLQAEWRAGKHEHIPLNQMARLWGSERQNAPCWLGYVWTGRRQYDGDLPASMDPADWWRYFSDHGWRTDLATRAYFEERDKNFTMTFTFHPEDNTPIPNNIPHPNPESEPAESRKRAKVAVEPAPPPRRSRRTRTKRS